MFTILFFLQVFILRETRKVQKPIDNFIRQRRGSDPYPAFMSVKIRRLQQWALLCLCVLSVLCVRISSLKAQEESLKAWEAQCHDYFEEIIKIQDLRQRLQRGLNTIIENHERGYLTKEKLDITVQMWHNTESGLRTKVTRVYDNAYAEGCFETTN